MNVSKDNIAGFMLGISVGVGIGFVLTPSGDIDRKMLRVDESSTSPPLKRIETEVSGKQSGSE